MKGKLLFFCRLAFVCLKSFIKEKVMYCIILLILVIVAFVGFHIISLISYDLLLKIFNVKLSYYKPAAEEGWHEQDVLEVIYYCWHEHWCKPYNNVRKLCCVQGITPGIVAYYDEVWCWFIFAFFASLNNSIAVELILFFTYCRFTRFRKTSQRWSVWNCCAPWRSKVAHARFGQNARRPNVGKQASQHATFTVREYQC